MSNAALHTFAARVSKFGLVSSNDVRQLQRDILPDGIGSREEAELLLALGRTVSRADASFTDWVVAALVDFVVWGARPTGYVDADTARWLIPLLLRAETSVARRITQEVAHEAEGVDKALLSLFTGRNELVLLAA